MRRALLILAATFVTTAASAAEIDFSAVMKTPDDQNYTECLKADPASPQRCEQLVDLTLGRLAAGALNSPEPGTTPQDLVKRGTLAMRVFAAKKVALEAGDIELIKTSLAKRGTSPMLLVQAYGLLDPVSIGK